MEADKGKNAVRSNRVQTVQKANAGDQGRDTWLGVVVVFIVAAYALIGIIAFTVWALTRASTYAKAHEAPSGWEYPIVCCHNKDCAPITKWVHDPVTGAVEVTTKFGTARTTTEWIEKNARPSGDGANHACLIAGDGGATIRCIFITGGT